VVRAPRRERGKGERTGKGSRPRTPVKPAVEAGSARARARRVIERRLAFERAAFLGLLAGFLAALFVDPSPPAEGIVLLLAFAALVAVVGAGYDGSREAVRDIDLLADTLERAGPGARIGRLPFMMRGHYEVWFDIPAASGPARFGLSFANSLISGARRSFYVLTVPVPAGAADTGKWAEPPKPLREALVSGAGLDKSVEIFLRRPRGRSAPWQVRLFVRPGRPLTADALWQLRQRAAYVAEAVARDGPAAVAWGASERFLPPEVLEPGAAGSAPLRER